MLLFLKLAWRNVLRNRRRTLIAGTAIGLGLAAMIFTDALYEGMMRHMMRSATSTYLGDAQLHRDGFRETRNVDLLIADLPDAVVRLQQSPWVQAFSARISTFAMIASPRNSAAVTLIGIDPQQESAVSKVDDAITSGSFLGETDARNVILGSKLAEVLEVDLGDRLVLTTTEAFTGEMHQELFRLSGIYHFGEAQMDEGMAFIHLPVAQRMTGLTDQAHELAIVLKEPKMAREESLPFWKDIAGANNEAVGWPIILPELNSVVQMSSLNLIVTGSILFAVVALGIVNTLFMSIYERMFEFGVLRAVGTSRGEIVSLVLLEAAWLAVISAGIGIVLAWSVTSLVAHYGIDYSGIEVAGVTIRESIRPIMQWSQFLIYPIWTILLTVLVGIYPGLYAARITPAHAMRKTF